MSGSGFLVDWLTATGGLTTIDLWEAVTDPGANNDDVDTAAIGKQFNEGDLWLNTVSGVMWVCMDNATGAAVWNEHVQSESTPADNSVVRFDGTDGVHIQNSAWSIDDTGVLGTIVDAAGNIGAPANNRPANVYAATSFNLASALGLATTPANGLLLQNTTAATGGATEQYTPSIEQSGTVWAGASSTYVGTRQTGYVYDGGGFAEYIEHTFETKYGGAAWTKRLSISSTGDVYMETAAGADLLWRTDGGGNIGASGATRPASVFASSSFNVASTGTFTLDSTFSIDSSNRSTGLGTTVNLRSVVDTPTIFLATHASRDAADAVVFATVFDRNAASITNANTVRIHSFGWTNNADAYTELVAIRADGDLYMQAQGNIGVSGAPGAGTPANVYSQYLRAYYTIYADAGSYLRLGFGAYGAGVGWSDTIGCNRGGSSMDMVNFRSDYDSANTYLCRIGYDRNSASAPVNAATMRLCSWGYLDNTDTYNELVWISATGALTFADTGTATVTGDIADGAASIVHKLDSSNTMSTAGAKLLSVQNNGVEKFYVDKDGDVVSDTEMNAAQYMWAGSSGVGIWLDAATGGVGVTGRELRTESVLHTLQLRSVRSSGSGNISIALDADVNAAAINDGQLIASFGWLDNADARTQAFGVKPLAVALPQWAVADAPTAAEGDYAYCTDESGGACPVYYDGSNWCRVDDNTTIS